MPRCLVISGGFTVIDGQSRHLDQQARRLGFADLRGCLHALLDQGWNIPQLATHLDTTQATIRRAITTHHLPQPPHRQQLARQRQHAAHQRATTRAAELGFASIQAYLADRLATQAWTLAEVAGELGAAPTTVRRLMDHYQARRVGPTRRQQAQAAQNPGPAKLTEVFGQRRLSRLAELGVADLDSYLHDRRSGTTPGLRRRPRTARSPASERVGSVRPVPAG